MDIEVVICTHNRERLIKKVIASLNNCSLPEKTNISILVLANACSDNTHAFLNEYQTKQKANNLLPLQWNAVPKPGKSHALNYAIPKLQGDLIAMIDDDHRISENYFAVLADAFNKYKEVGIFFGKILPDWTGKEPKWAHLQGKYAIYPLPVPHFDKGDESFEYHDKVATPGGGNLALRREVFNKVGDFNTELGPEGHNLGGGEDSDFVKRAISIGIKLRYLPDMVQYHYVDPERFKFSYILTKSFQRSRSVALISKKEITRVPNFIWKKLFVYFFSTIFSFNIDKSRFYTVRLAAALGELSAYRKLSGK
ncbi:MAG TPA: glycosyltransferase [Aeromonadales bacterium]|nr:glycosyltransferase [Aeromonadales bacterium]